LCVCNQSSKYFDTKFAELFETNILPPSPFLQGSLHESSLTVTWGVYLALLYSCSFCIYQLMRWGTSVCRVLHIYIHTQTLKNLPLSWQYRQLLQRVSFIVVLSTATFNRMSQWMQDFCALKLPCSVGR
jgi:hypothetical protein